MSATKPTFVFIHGYWHNSGTWMRVIPALEARGFSSRALDLPGAGPNAEMPKAFFKRPLDATAFASEPSPIAGVTQEERTRLVAKVINELAGPLILVGHSMGGATISDVAEAMPERLAAVVYLTAFLLPPGVPPMAVVQHETMASALVPQLFLADPSAVGALRIDPRSEDSEYRAVLKAAFYADVSDTELLEVTPRLHCDEPVSTTLRPSAVTAARFGKTPRHYIRCTNDRAITLAGQDYMIGATDAAIGSRTIQHTLESSHSPFFSRRDELVELLANIAA
jgi:pimeloyl-ACP methyl ester carboxylesterase